MGTKSGGDRAWLGVFISNTFFPANLLAKYWRRMYNAGSRIKSDRCTKCSSGWYAICLRHFYTRWENFNSTDTHWTSSLGDNWASCIIIFPPAFILRSRIVNVSVRWKRSRANRVENASVTVRFHCLASSVAGQVSERFVINLQYLPWTAAFQRNSSNKHPEGDLT